MDCLLELYAFHISYLKARVHIVIFFYRYKIPNGIFNFFKDFLFTNSLITNHQSLITNHQFTMQQISSSWTVILKYFLPAVWITFFATFTMGAFFSEEPQLGGIPIMQFRIGALAFLCVGIAFLYWAVMGLKRVELDDKFVYVTNYRKNYRYPYHNIEKIEEKDWGIFKTIHIHLKVAGHFGKKITFIASKSKMHKFFKAHPQLTELLMKTAV